MNHSSLNILESLENSFEPPNIISQKPILCDSSKFSEVSDDNVVHTRRDILTDIFLKLKTEHFVTEEVIQCLVEEFSQVEEDWKITTEVKIEKICQQHNLFSLNSYFICLYFLIQIYCLLQVGTTLSAIEENITAATPFIALVGKSQKLINTVIVLIIEFEIFIFLDTDYEGGKKYHIFIEYVLVNSETTTIVEAVQLVIAFYYNFNLKYEKTMIKTLIFFQKFFCQLSTKKNRGENTDVNKLSAIQRLINNLNKFIKEDEVLNGKIQTFSPSFTNTNTNKN
jgi:hypothetical protein